jgi:hypothetical protein
MDLLEGGIDELRAGVSSAGGLPYNLHLEYLWWQSLNVGLLEYSLDDHETLREITEESIDALMSRLVSPLPNRERWSLITPVPTYDDDESCRHDVVRGRLCAGVLRSYDDYFPGLDEPDSWNYYSEANLVWITRRGEGILPPRVRALIDWEEVATPGG